MLRSLNLYGLDHLDPVILAALADERPLLLIAPHGTAKSELLNRLASVLKLEHRHYNASLIAFDDLLGYPVPNAGRDGLTYLRTPGDLWNAESVFLDEISRCRPETQNKLFSIVHEKKVQGLPLERLRYRWAAMNPPATADQDEHEEVYEGSLPLDPALADRFPWVVQLPVLSDLSREDRLGLIDNGDRMPDGVPDIGGLVGRVRGLIAETPVSQREWAASYVDALLPPLQEAGLGISGRRAGHLAKSMHALRAAARVLGVDAESPTVAYLALKHGIPQRGQGRKIDESMLKAVHRAALAVAGTPAESPWHKLSAIRDPVERVAAALPHYPGGLTRTEISSLVCDAYASLSIPRRYLLARRLLPLAVKGGFLNVPAFELISDPARKVRKLVEGGTQNIQMPRAKASCWDALIAAIGLARKRGFADDELGNYLLTLHVVEKQEFKPAEIIELDREWGRLFSLEAPEAATAA
jgi:MoxR-like ATPase